MASIYTCPLCRRRYTIYGDGDYLCTCGSIFSYPPVLSTERACFIGLEQAGRERPERKVAPRPADSRNCAGGFAGMLRSAMAALF